MPLTLDIGGEGRHPLAWNLNSSRTKTVGPHKGQPIKRLIVARAEAIPLADRSVELVIVDRTPLTRLALEEIRRVVAPGGRVVLRHVPLPGKDRHALASAVLSGNTSRSATTIGGQYVQETEFRWPREEALRPDVRPAVPVGPPA